MNILWDRIIACMNFYNRAGILMEVGGLVFTEDVCWFPLLLIAG